MSKYDVVFIGGGPGGYVGAIYASLQGFNVALVESDRIGGTCLTKGCIPTKTLLHHAKVLQTIKNAKQFGIDVSSFSFHYEEMVQRKNHVVADLAKSVEGLVKSHGVTIFKGTGHFTSKNSLKVVGPQIQEISFSHAIIATGSIPSHFSFCPVDGKLIHDSTSILEMQEVPEKLIVLGGGYIGCEFASLFHELGSKVTIVEFLPNIVAAQGKSVSNFLEKSFRNRGIEILTNTKMQKVEAQGKGVLCTLSNGEEIAASHLLVSVGRSPFTEGLSLNNAALPTTERGFIEVNDYLQTLHPHIYAIGDVNGKSMLAHSASHQAIAAVNHIKGQKRRMEYHKVPAVIFTYPEIATIGYSLDEAKKQGYHQAMSSTFPYMALGKAKATRQEEGFSELVTDKKTGQILGAFMAGHEAGNMIAEIALCMENELTVDCLAHTIHPHPTFSEVWMETAHLAMGMPIHLQGKKK